MFSINFLEITANKTQWEQNKSLYKNLLSDDDFTNLPSDSPVNKRYLFNDYYISKDDRNIEINPKKTLPENFFGDNINIQAIVGKNGSGKSTLMDLMYTAINNFCYMFERGNDRPGADALYYVPNLYINLFFSLPEMDNNVPAYLSCNDSSIFLFKYSKAQKKYLEIKKFTLAEKEQKIAVSVPNGHRNWLKGLTTLKGNSLLNINSNSEYLGICNSKKKADLVRDFFYTIVSNYSTQSFLYPNYNGEIYYHYGKNDKNHSAYYDDKINASWINSLFHKNDGYVCPIVLNPYREWGKIDCVKEANLSIDRITALLIYERQQKKAEPDFPKLFYPYTFKTLNIRLKKKYLLNKIIYLASRYLDAPSTTINKCIDVLHHYKNDFAIAHLANLTVSDIIRAQLGISTNHKGCPLEKITFLYYQLKIIDIINKYTDYSGYKNCIKLSTNNNHEISIKLSNKALFTELISKLINDESHITKKLKRIDNFLFLMQLIPPQKNKFDYERRQFYWFNYFRHIAKFYSNRINNKHISTTYRNFCRHRNPFNRNSLFSSPMTIDVCLPPSIFEYDLILNKDNNKVINYKQLSSGELQLFQTLSTHAYHIENLISIHTNLSNNRPKYHLINLVFDELEICFHPEYQRQFVNRLINMLNAIIFQKKHFFFNIFLITHSPFILSDIPKQRILYLKEGSQHQAKRINPFSGNIGEMVYDSFFMEKTIGDFAENKIKRIIKIKNGKNPDNKEGNYSNDEKGIEIKKAHRDEANQLLSIVGDSVIRSLINEMDRGNK